MPDVYLDYNASSPIRPEAAETVARVLQGEYGNPSSIHRRGHRSKMILESARESVAALIKARPGEIVFTSGGTEANNLALLGAARRFHSGHIIVSALEHSSVLEAARQLEAEGRRISRILPDGEGCVAAAAILGEVGPETRMISLMHSSNEVGTLQPVAEVAAGIRSRATLLHTDAVQSAGKVPLEVAALGVDLLSLSAHKIGGPCGVGCLWVREGVVLEALLRGGGQESNRRAGTEAIALIAGFGAAAELALAELGSEPARIGGLRDRLEQSLERGIPDLRFHGRGRPRLPNTVSAEVRGCQGEEMVMALDLEGIAVSTGSACSAGTVRPSHVLEAMGCSREEARSTLRISLGHGTSREDLLHLEEALTRIVGRIRLGAAGAPMAPAMADRGGA